MSKETREIYEFGPFRLDLSEHSLSRYDGTPSGSLPEKAFQTLCVLIRNHGHLVTKQELMDAVWPDAYVEENNLEKCVHMIRQTLGEAPGGREYIETVRKHGYRFVADVHLVESARKSKSVYQEIPVKDDLHGFVERRSAPGSIQTPQLTKSWQPAIIRDTVVEDLEPKYAYGVKVQSDKVNHPSLSSESNSASLARGEHSTADVSKIRGNSVSDFRKTLITAIAAAATLLALALVVILGLKLWQSKTQTVVPGPVTQKRLSAEGGATRVAISPDGRYSAVAQNGAIVLFDQENDGGRVLVAASKDIRIMTIVFRPDGAGIYYGTRNVDQSLVSVYSIPLSGGEPKKILDDIFGSLAFSPDGKKIVFIRRYAELNEYAVITANSDGSNLNKLASSQLPNRFDSSPIWSPDGTKVLCSAVSVEGGFHFTIAKIDVSTGSVGFVPQQQWKSVGSMYWLADSRRVVLAGQDDKSINQQIWRVDTETGSASPITNDSFVYESISGSTDGRSILAVKVRQTSHVWMLGDKSVQLTSGFDNYDGFNGLAWLRDGTIFYHSRTGGRDAIWRMQADGSNSAAVTHDDGGGFAVSPDGRLLVFQDRQTADHLGLQLMDLANRSVRSLTQNVTAMYPDFLPDGKTVVFSLYDQKLSLYEIPVEGGQPELLSDEFRTASTPAVSPSGNFVAFAINRVQSGSIQSGIAVIEANSKKLVATHKARISLGNQYEKSTLQWSADESEVYFLRLDESISNIMRLRLADGSVSNVTNFTDGRIFNFAVEPGGSRMLISRGIVEREATLLQIDQP